jgi:hypothetical protein
MTTTTEKYIKKAVQDAKKEFGGHTMSNCNITMDMQADGATQVLAEALKAQAKANALNSEAMLSLAATLKPIEVCAIKITNDAIKINDDSTF